MEIWIKGRRKRRRGWRRRRKKRRRKKRRRKRLTEISKTEGKGRGKGTKGREGKDVCEGKREKTKGSRGSD